MNKRYIQKDFKTMARTGYAKDITTARFHEVEALNLELVSLSKGIYGMNGGLFKSRVNGEFYVVTARNSLLFYLA